MHSDTLTLFIDPFHLHAKRITVIYLTCAFDFFPAFVCLECVLGLVRDSGTKALGEAPAPRAIHP
jgi:hypothetical protein